MPDLFTFTTGDAFVSKYLTATQLGTIGTQQASTEYIFEFHGGHTTGYPIYVRMSGNKDTSNLPKFDTKNKSAANYGTIDKLANGGKLKAGLSQGAQTEILNIIANEWANLQAMANGYWTNTPAPVAVVAAPAANTIPCPIPNCAGLVPLVINQHTQKREKQKCPICYNFA